MISTELQSLAAALGEMAGTVSEETWRVLRQVRDNLRAQAERVAELEARYEPGAGGHYAA